MQVAIHISGKHNRIKKTATFLFLIIPLYCLKNRSCRILMAARSAKNMATAFCADIVSSPEEVVQLDFHGKLFPSMHSTFQQLAEDLERPS